MAFYEDGSSSGKCSVFDYHHDLISTYRRQISQGSHHAPAHQFGDRRSTTTNRQWASGKLPSHCRGSGNIQRSLVLDNDKIDDDGPRIRLQTNRAEGGQWRLPVGHSTSGMNTQYKRRVSLSLFRTKLTASPVSVSTYCCTSRTELHRV